MESAEQQGEILRGGSAVVTVPALSAVWLEKEDCMDAELYGEYVSYACMDADRKTSGESGSIDSVAADGELPLSFGTVLFCPPKHFRFADPELTVVAEGMSWW